MTTQDQLDDIHKYIPGTLEDIAMMIPCHVRTLKNIRSGTGTTRPIIQNRIDELHDKAMKIKAIAES